MAISDPTAVRPKGRFRAGIRRHGPVGLARVVRDRLVSRIWLDEAHIWYVLALDRLKLLPMADGYELRPGTPGDLPVMAQDPDSAPLKKAKRRLARGASLWLVTIGGQIAFVAWVFGDAAPAIAARGGELTLPPGAASLESTFTNAEHRGRGIAGAAWTAIAEQLAGDGYEVLITKVEVENAPSRRAFENAGFRAASEMRLRRRGVRTRVSIARTATELTESEARAEAWLERTLRR